MLYCTKCKQHLLQSCFNKNKASSTGFNNWCKNCRSEYSKTERSRLKSRAASKRFRLEKGYSPKRRTTEINEIKTGKSLLITCNGCEEKLNISLFGKLHNAPLTFASRCKKCESETAILQRKEKRGTSPYGRFDKWSPKDKRRARVLAQTAVYSGKIDKLPCLICGNHKSQGHHENYDKPLDIVWLCSKHHGEVHTFGMPA